LSIDEFEQLIHPSLLAAKGDELRHHGTGLWLRTVCPLDPLLRLVELP
jgi:hypothetical protein